MIIDKDRIRFGFTDIFSVLISVLYLIGIRVWFPVCEPMESGFMSCHWAGEMLKGISILLVIMSVVHLLIPDDRIKIGTDITLCAVYVLTFCVPGMIIDLCKMSEMNCRSHTAVLTAVFMVVMMLSAIADIILYASHSNGKKHKRPEMEKKV